ncbi:MAG: hypothetical protein V4621_00610 [Pseudomonadota bacterium]
MIREKQERAHVNIWVVIWALIAIIILGSSGWSYWLLFRQKNTWAALSRKYSMTFVRGGLSSPPEAKGLMRKDLLVTLYTEQQALRDGRSQRYRNVILIEAPFGLPGGGAVATAPALKAYIMQQKLKEDFTPDAPQWPKEALFRTLNAALLAPNMTPDRLKVLQTLLNMPNADTMVIFNEQTLFLRLETADPLADLKKLENLLNKLFTVVDTLRPAVG